MKHLWTSVVVVMVAVGCAAGPPPEEPPPRTEVVQQPIVGGTRSSTCQWPTAVGLAESCTATLIHPRIVSTAAHCVDEGTPDEITFGEVWSGSRVVRRVPVERCVSATGTDLEGDFAYCVLGEAVDDVPIVPVLYGCETAILQPGQLATLAGYGRRGGISFSAGVKHQVEVELGRIEGNDIYLGNARKGGCQGDSGGPAYVQLADGTWRVFGATSRGSLFCTSQTVYTLIHPFVAWMEAGSGFDVTPCHDADGTWNPGPGCTGFPTNPGAAGHSWDDMCGGQQRGGAGATCGAARAP